MNFQETDLQKIENKKNIIKHQIILLRIDEYNIVSMKNEETGE